MPKGEGLTLSTHVDKETLFDQETVAYDLFMRLLFTEGGVKDDGITSTVVDLRTLKGGLSDEQLKYAVAKQMGIKDVSDLDFSKADSEKRETINKNYERINAAFAQSARFIRDEMGLPLPNEVASTRVQSWVDLSTVLRKVSAFQSGEGGLDRHLAYCALVKCAIAALELETRGVQDLQQETSYIQSIATSQRTENKSSPLINTRPFSGEEEIHGNIAMPNEQPCEATFEIRDKTWASIMRKYLAKAEANAKEAYKDEIAMRFKVDGRRHGVVRRVVEYYKNYFNVEVTEIANKGVISQGEFDTLVDELKKTKGSRGMRIDPKSNPKSDPAFAVLQMTGKLQVPPAGDITVPKSQWRERGFEIQFVDTARKPHTGLASDAVYALKKDLIIATRLFGSFQKKWFIEHAIKAVRDTQFTNMSDEQIFSGLLDAGFIFKKPGSRDKYAATEVWKNWLGMSGLVTDERMRKFVGHEVSAASAKKK